VRWSAKRVIGASRITGTFGCPFFSVLTLTLSFSRSNIVQACLSRLPRNKAGSTTPIRIPAYAICTATELRRLVRYRTAGRTDRPLKFLLSMQRKELVHEHESVARIESAVGDAGSHALHGAFGCRADPVRDSVRCLDVQSLVFWSLGLQQKIKTRRLRCRVFF